eukprot:TRINITY_DN2396_c0_g1_i1.p1 TRINITY_DN2396_c0_g1~~TRINITY_DN2396_c0_g1_i1.p1  ORF type:complete len:256 (+),score=16.04 TRINITY_DN2396_c0_g1_i1:2-769(+)
MYMLPFFLTFHTAVRAVLRLLVVPLSWHALGFCLRYLGRRFRGARPLALELVILCPCIYYKCMFGRILTMSFEWSRWLYFNFTLLILYKIAFHSVKRPRQAILEVVTAFIQRKERVRVASSSVIFIPSESTSDDVVGSEAMDIAALVAVMECIMELMVVLTCNYNAAYFRTHDIFNINGSSAEWLWYGGLQAAMQWLTDAIGLGIDIFVLNMPVWPYARTYIDVLATVSFFFIGLMIFSQWLMINLLSKSFYVAP